MLPLGVRRKENLNLLSLSLLLLHHTPRYQLVSRTLLVCLAPHMTGSLEHRPLHLLAHDAYSVFKC